MRPDQKLIESLKNSNFCIDEINEVGQRLSVDDAVNLLNRYGNESGTGGHWSDIVKITHDDYIESEGELKKSDVGKYRDVDGNILTNSEIFKWLKEVEKENAEQKEEENRLKNDPEYAMAKKKEDDDRKAIQKKDRDEYEKRLKLSMMKNPTYNPKGVEKGGKTLADIAKKAGFHFDFDHKNWVGGNVNIFINDLNDIGFERKRYSDGAPNYTDGAGFEWFVRTLSDDGTFGGNDEISVGVNRETNIVNLYLYAHRKVVESNDQKKRASQINVGDKTKMFGTVTNVTAHTTGDSIEIIGDKDRSTVWKNTLIDIAGS